MYNTCARNKIEGGYRFSSIIVSDVFSAMNRLEEIVKKKTR